MTKEMPANMESKTDSPYRDFYAAEWAQLRQGAQLTLSEDELHGLRGRGETVSLQEVKDIYLPLARLISLYVEATQRLFAASNSFLLYGCDEAEDKRKAKVPYIIGIAGSVAVGKSTSSRILQALLARPQEKGARVPKVDLITTDGFLYPTAYLEKHDLMNKKGFPESFDLPALRQFLSQIKSGVARVAAPVYSHVFYDIVPNQKTIIDRPDILIVEGLNVLQPAPLPQIDPATLDGSPASSGVQDHEIPFVSDFFDFSIYIDAAANHIKEWYVQRFLALKRTAFLETGAYFRRYAELSDEDAREVAEGIWQEINYANLCENILPTRGRADLILHKAQDHSIDKVLLRKI